MSPAERSVASLDGMRQLPGRDKQLFSKIQHLTVYAGDEALQQLTSRFCGVQGSYMDSLDSEIRPVTVTGKPFCLHQISFQAYNLRTGSPWSSAR